MGGVRGCISKWLPSSATCRVITSWCIPAGPGPWAEAAEAVAEAAAGTAEQANALRLATGDADGVPFAAMHPDPDDLPMVGNQHQLIFLDNGEAGHHLPALRLERFVIIDVSVACLPELPAPPLLPALPPLEAPVAEAPRA